MFFLPDINATAAILQCCLPIMVYSIFRSSKCIPQSSWNHAVSSLDDLPKPGNHTYLKATQYPCTEGDLTFNAISRKIKATFHSLIWHHTQSHKTTDSLISEGK